MKIFLDIGAYQGQTLAAVLETDFDQIYCFEPASACWPYIEKLADKRTHIQRFGLWDKTVEMPLNDPGTKGASLWVKDNRNPHTELTQELCEFRRASEWFGKHLTGKDQVYFKLNVEGCECDVLDDLLDSGEFEKVTYALICFDVCKIRTLKYREQQILGRLQPFMQRLMFRDSFRDQKTHYERIHKWLRECGHQ